MKPETYDVEQLEADTAPGAARARRRGIALEILSDALLLCGTASAAFGAWLWWPPAGFLLGGALLIAGGWRLGQALGPEGGG